MRRCSCFVKTNEDFLVLRAQREGPLERRSCFSGALEVTKRRAESEMPLDEARIHFHGRGCVI